MNEVIVHILSITRKTSIRNNVRNSAYSKIWILNLWAFSLCVGTSLPQPDCRNVASTDRISKPRFHRHNSFFISMSPKQTIRCSQWLRRSWWFPVRRWILVCLVSWLLSFFVSWFFSLIFSWFQGFKNTLNALLEECLSHISKNPFHVFWKILIPYPRCALFY